jgi:hypothetical protein
MKLKIKEHVAAALPYLSAFAGMGIIVYAAHKLVERANAVRAVLDSDIQEAYTDYDESERKR